MEGVYIGRSRGAAWVSVSALLAAASFGAAVFLGPVWVFWLSGIGAALALTGVVLAARAPSIEKPVIFPSLVAGLHAILLVVALVLHAMFLSPLSDELRKMPKLQAAYVDGRGLFQLKGPVGWTFRPVPSALESGVRMQPSDQSLYMGVSEATVFVRRLDKAPKSAEEFLARAADSFSGGHREGKLFDLRTERGTSLGGAPVMWSELSLKKFWVPLYQISVFGVKNDRYLCSVSATGLQSHADLSKLLCLGLFERINVTDKPGS